MKYFLVCLLLCITATTFGQSKIIFKERFSNNKRHWKLQHDSDFVVKIDSGKLYIEKFGVNKIRNGCLWLRKAIPGLNTARDFSITFYAKVLFYKDIFPMIDMQWGNLCVKDNYSVFACDSLYQLEMKPTGNVRMAYFRKGWTYYPWSDRPTTNDTEEKDIYFSNKQDLSALIKQNKFNKYEIIQQADTLSVKINKVLVYKRKIKVIGGNSIGIQQCLKTAWQIDKLIIRQ
ncbi:hypothetical protein [Ferruginibacter sp.]|nr:hypothetical protein [Ferruginibacter sp.]